MKKYVFKDYSQIFPELFKIEENRISSQIDIPLMIEHVGSTAVPGLGGKGIIDIALATDRKNMDSVSKQLQKLGYEFKPNFSTSERMYFINHLPDLEEGSRRYHLHLTYPENKEWREFLGFRDFLCSDPEALQEYAELKKRATLECKQDGNTYRKLKEPMFQKFRSST